MERITSKDNEKMKWVTKLQQNAKARRESGFFVCEGPRLAKEALRCGLVIEAAFATEVGIDKDPALWQKVCQKAGTAYQIAPALEGKISQVKAPQGMYLVCRIPVQPKDGIAKAGDKLLVLDGVQDPGNLGTIIRSADAFGIAGIVLGEGCADCFGPKAMRSAMGSLFRMKIWSEPDLAETLDMLHRVGFCSYAAALDETALRLGEEPFPQKAVVIIGNEGNGVSQKVLKTASKKLFIPMKGQTESLNAGVAASIILWELCR